MKIRKKGLKKQIDDFIIEVANLEGLDAEKFGRKIWKRIDGFNHEWQIDAYFDEVYTQAICPTKIEC